MNEEFTVLSGDPSPEQFAALTAVIEGLLEEQGELDRRRGTRGQSAWQQSQRPIRGTLSPGYGAWRGFTGK